MVSRTRLPMFLTMLSSFCRGRLARCMASRLHKIVMAPSPSWVAPTKLLNTITFQGRTTAAVGSDNVIHFTVGTKSYSFIIPSTADLTAFHGNAQSIQSGTQVQVQVQYNGSTPTVILVGLAQ